MFKAKLIKIFLGLMLLGTSIVPATLLNASGGPRDCDNNAVMNCGAYSKDEFVRKLNNGDGRNSSGELKRVYNSWGINANTINDTKLGTVHKNGNISVDGKIVATDARSVGREYMSGSHKDPKSGLWIRPTSVSFASSELQAFVKFNVNGRFEWAVIKSCGNMVDGRPRAPSPPPPTPNPSYKCLNLSAQPDNGITPLNVAFSARAEAKHTKIQSYHFNFGDGTTVNVDTNKDRARSNHTYNNAGIYTATVIVRTNDGHTRVTRECSQVVRVRRQGEASFDCSSLTAQPNNGEAPLTVNFNAIGVVQHTNIVDYLYDFGDGISTNSVNNTISHTYNTGDYTASVRIRTGAGTTPIVERCQVRLHVTNKETPPNGGGGSTSGQPIPATGPETAVLGIFGTGALGLGIKKYLLSKKSLKKAILSIAKK